MGKAHIAVMGAGTFGTAITWMLKQAGMDVTMWAFLEEEAKGINEKGHTELLPDVDLTGTYATSDVAEALKGADGAIIVCPSFGVASLAEKMAETLPSTTPVLILSKGLEPRSGRLFIDAVAERIGNKERIAVLSGPNHAEELSKGAFAGAVVACENIETARFFQGLISNDFYRLYVSDDPTGVSLCGASKNVIAIACGIARGAGMGDNTVALLMTRGLQEIFRLVKACGGKQETCMGLAGVGDLDVTCNSPHSRNGSYGEAFAKTGISVPDYEAQTRMVVEGAHAIGSLLQVAHEKGIEMPIMEMVDSLLKGEVDFQSAVVGLMGRDLKVESW